MEIYLIDLRICRALALASPEIRFEISNETNDPIDVISKPMLDTNSLVEEFMLLANISVADHIFKNFPECAVLRRHPTPPASNFEPIIKAGNTLVTQRFKSNPSFYHVTALIKSHRVYSKRKIESFQFALVRVSI